MTVRCFSGDELVIATHNRGKMAEFADMMQGRGIRFYAATDFNLPSPPETGTTFLENGTIKALAAAKGSGKIALADDSGLCVAALGGAPGVYSADMAEKPDGSRDFDWAMDKLLDQLKGKDDRRAYFVSCIVLAWPDGHVESVEGHALGRILTEKRGRGGHGFDPLFMPDGYDVTYGEMPHAEKNKISHRAIAFKMMMDKCF